MVMIMVNIYEVKAKLSEYLEAVARGERVVICRRNRPVAELRAAGAVRRARRPIGLDKGRLSVPPSFFEPLPDDLLEAFEAGPVLPGRPAAAPRRASTRTRRTRTRRKPR
jgi:antitoxin (DNA-binding transcriptional repressor) of toxin-antitoxin stability system